MFRVAGGGNDVSGSGGSIGRYVCLVYGSVFSDVAFICTCVFYLFSFCFKEPVSCAFDTDLFWPSHSVYYAGGDGIASGSVFCIFLDFYLG